MLSLIFFFLTFPFPEDLHFTLYGHFKFLSRLIIVTLCLINLHLYYFNNYVLV